MAVLCEDGNEPPGSLKNQSDSLMAADGDCHHLCKLMALVRHRWSISVAIGEIRNTCHLVTDLYHRLLAISCDRGRTARQCHQELQEACGAAALPYRTVTRWVRAFRQGRESVLDMSRSGHPPMKTFYRQPTALFSPSTDANGIQRLPHRWEHVVRNAGDYIEGLSNLEAFNTPPRREADVNPIQDEAITIMTFQKIGSDHVHRAHCLIIKHSVIPNTLQYAREPEPESFCAQPNTSRPI
ncbi:hypothetical protein ANN_27171 [Periplaneta americana]|uniref:Mos1 transposase HTH domain-containing protein n=1 Tax=Periplaneta americana TaxID=6978 RepID=A0ABQ8RXA6_PERAM|nr:hypothetical protein ANN_27171 [Periplaneta americana]